MRKVAVFIIMLLLIAGCTQTKSAPTETKSKPREEVEEPSPEFKANMQKIDAGVDKLKKLPPETLDPKTAYEVASEILEPVYFVENYIKEHPKVRTGPETLVYIAATWNLIDIHMGGQKKRTAEAYYLLIDLYPNHKKTPDAKRWLRLNGYQVKD